MIGMNRQGRKRPEGRKGCVPKPLTRPDGARKQEEVLRKRAKTGSQKRNNRSGAGNQGLDKPKTRSGAAPLRACQSLKSAHDGEGRRTAATA